MSPTPTSPQSEAVFDEVPDPLAGVPAPRLPDVRAPSRRPTRGDLARRGRLAFVLSIGWMGAELAWFGLRGDLAHVSGRYLLLMVGAPLVTAILCIAAALSHGRLGLGARIGVLFAVATLPLVAMVGAVLVTSPAVPDGTPGTLGESAYCFNTTLGFASLPLLAAAFALRHAFVSRAVWRSAALGVGAGLAAVGLVNLHCDRVGALHLMVGHVGALFVIALAGAALLSYQSRV